LTLDPVSVAHVLKHSTVYEKPWQSRRLITSLIGCGLLGAEGQVHKRQRRVATPAFSIQNMRALVPLVFAKGSQLRDRWQEMVAPSDSATIDVSHWLSRATFDVIGIAGMSRLFPAFQLLNRNRIRL
jgi:cytochrome P450